jgi:hypothetical protein
MSQRVISVCVQELSGRFPPKIWPSIRVSFRRALIARHLSGTPLVTAR